MQGSCLNFNARARVKVWSGPSRHLQVTSKTSSCLRHTQRLQCRAAAPVTLDSSISTDGLILPRGESGSWDDAGVGHPVVRCFVGDNEERWYMWYSGRSTSSNIPSAVDIVAPGAGSMGLAISSDGLTWTRGSSAVEGTRGPDAAADVGAAITPNGDWWCFDTCHLAVSDVQILSSSSVQSGVGVYWCFYTGGSYEPFQLPAGIPGTEGLLDPNSSSSSSGLEGVRLRPGLAMSQDARNWARIEGDHHTGALFDVGAPGTWDELFVGRPQVLAVKPRDMRMFYHSWDQSRQRYVIGVATSPDGFKWNRQGVIFDPVALGAGPQDHDAKGALSCNVVRDFDNRQFLMVYEAVASDGTTSIGLAVSKDLTAWKRCPTPILTGSSVAGSASSSSSSTDEAAGASCWDRAAVGAPSAVSMDAGKWRLYYGGKASSGIGAWDGIGLALSDQDGPRFENVPIRYTKHATAQSDEA